MKRFVVLMALLGGVLFVAPTPAQAGGAATASVSIVNAVTYDEDNDFPLTVCIDGDLIESDVSTETTLDPIDLEPGTYFFEFFQSDVCEDSDPFAEGDVTVAAGDDVTVMAYWGQEGREVVVLANDVSCVEAGFTRVTFRHGASMDPVSWLITPEGGEEFIVFTDVGEGEQAVTSDLVAQTYTASRADDSEDSVDTGEPGELITTTVYYLYIFGGADGSVGYFTEAVEVEQCTPETTTTAAPTTTTTAAAAAVVTPCFTG